MSFHDGKCHLLLIFSLLFILAMSSVTYAQAGARLNGAEAHTSCSDLPTSNGYSAAVYSTKQHGVAGFYEHIYKNFDQSTTTRNFLNDAHFVVTADGQKYDLSQLHETSLGYIPGTGIIRAVYDFGFEAYYFAPMLYKGHGFVMIGKFTKPVKSGKIQVVYDDNIDGVAKDEKPIVTEWATTDNNGNELEKRIAFTLPVYGEDASIKKFAENNNMLAAEIEWWHNWQNTGKLPFIQDDKKRELYMQSLAVLKMAQCREPGKSYGQILASLPPGMWNIAWVRDGAYAITALAKSGHPEEAKSGLEFMLKADASYYEHYKHTDGKDYGIGRPYQISVCRYFGSGKEESDFNEDGPNIELDGFGMFIWALEVYIQESGDTAFLGKYWDIVSKKIADVLCSSIDDTGLIRIDSGPWERHLPGKHFTYTSIFATQGLQSAAALAKLAGKTEDSIKYWNTAEKLSKTINRKLVDARGTLQGNLEGKSPEDFEYYSGESVEAFNFGIIDPKSDIAKNTIKAYDKYLRIATRDNGYFRVNNADDWYDRQEWIILDLRMVSALRLMGETDKAENILNWVVDQSNKNYNLIAELYDENTADYQGAVPMCGFGAGAYVLSFYN